MVTASYLSDGMADLHDKAAEAGVTVVNEVGVDPGKILDSRVLKDSAKVEISCFRFESSVFISCIT